jgi:hypothetical protein
MDKITSIVCDLHAFQCFKQSGFAVYAPAIEVFRGSKHRCIFNNKARAFKWAQRYITRNSGAIKVDNKYYITWYHNVNPMYTNGYIYDGRFLTFEVLPNWELKITLSDTGRKAALERLEGLEEDSYKWNKEIESIEQDLFEYALCNGWTLDPNDDGRWFITLDGSIDDNGDLDVNPGDLGWSYNDYVFTFVCETLLEKGYVIFDPYYFGETSLQDQRYI